MEEDIEYLQRFINRCKKSGSEFYGILKPGHFESLQNLINKYKEQQHIIELMADCIRCVDIDDDKYFEHTERCYAENACRNCMIDYFKKKAKGE